MKEYLKIAWRNIWRNKRRTLITAASITFAVFIALVMRSFQLGTYSHMINNVVQAYTGYIQIQQANFKDDRTVENTFVLSDTLLDKINSVDNVTLAVPRFESFALASSGLQTKGVLVIGINPSNEIQLTKLDEKLVKIRLTDSAIQELNRENIPDELKKQLLELKNNSYSHRGKLEIDLGQFNGNSQKWVDRIEQVAAYPGRFLTDSDSGVIIADGLAKFLMLNVGDTITLFGQGYHASIAEARFVVQGVVKFPVPELNKSMVYLNLPMCQTLFDAPDRITSIAINVKNKNESSLIKTAENLRQSIDHVEYAAYTWRDLNKELVQQIESDNGSALIMLAMIYLIIGFGVFGTVLMMTAERRREFGVMVSIGMQKYKLGFIVFIEMLIIGFIGSIVGILGSAPVVVLGNLFPVRLTGDMAKSYEAFGIEPVLPMAWFDMYYINQVIVVITIIIIAIAYPLYTIFRLNEIKALRN